MIVSGPCFDQSQEYTCLFQVRRLRREVHGVYLDERRLLCLSPVLQLIGDVGFRLRVRGSGGMVTEIPQAPVPFYSRTYVLASFPGPAQIFSRSRKLKSGQRPGDEARMYSHCGVSPL